MDRWCIAFYHFSFCGSSYVGLMCILKSLSPSKISNLKQTIKHRGRASEGIIRVLKAKGGGGNARNPTAVMRQMCLQRMCEVIRVLKVDPCKGSWSAGGEAEAGSGRCRPPGAAGHRPHRCVDPQAEPPPCLRGWGSLSPQAAVAGPGRPHLGAVAALKS